MTVHFPDDRAASQIKEPLKQNQPEWGTALREVIAAEIRQSGPIPFCRYMELCLYHPELGYYSRAREQFGKGGDFYTSSDVHAVFGRLLARQFEEMWHVLGEPARVDLVELGPGRGLFASDVLDWTAKQFPEFAAALRYGMVEQSAQLRGRLRERLAVHVANGRATVFDSFEQATDAAGEHLIVFGNEFFDALPVDVVDHRGSVRVAERDGRLVEEFAAPSADELNWLDRYSVHAEEGERVEVCLAAHEWVHRIAAAFDGRRGFAVFIDYGYTREQQLAGRHRDTLMTYRKHQVQASPYDSPGEQDITAHVNWTALQASAAERELKALGLVTQSQFLMGIGEKTQFADAFRDTSHPQEQAKVALQLRHLISPEEMGEVFQVLVLAHGVEQGVRLSGLDFAR